MKNALDKIVCIPTEGGKKPPYQIISHPYCIDVITAYVQLSKLDFKDKGEYLKRIEDSIKYYCLSNKINFEYHFNNKYPIIISPTVNNFQWFFGLQLIGFDINKIKALLSFQQKRYQNEEADFTTFVEFAVYNIVKGFSQLDNSEHLKMIMEWVNEQRTLCIIRCKANIESNEDSTNNKKTKEDSNFTQKTKKTKSPKAKIVAPSFKLIALIKNPNYFKDNAINFMDAFKLLKGGGFIHTDTDYENFKNIFRSNEIKRESKIDWTGKKIDLKMFVLFLIKGEKINKLKYKWETTCNCFLYNSTDILPESLQKSNGKKDNENKLKEIVKLL